MPTMLPLQVNDVVGVRGDLDLGQAIVLGDAFPRADTKGTQS